MMQELMSAGATPTRTRDYDTIRNAIRKGLNFGTFLVQEEWMQTTWEWRLLGDMVEAREKGFHKWHILDIGDLDFLFSGGVFGQRMDTHLGFSCYDVLN